jgi:four helix bundle protein
MLEQNKLFRFEALDVWQRAADMAVALAAGADELEQHRRFRYAEQLRAAALSISNNIAEGSGSNSKRDFRNFLNFARRSAFECANMLLIFERQGAIPTVVSRQHLDELARICRMITGLSGTLSQLLAPCPKLPALI